MKNKDINFWIKLEDKYRKLFLIKPESELLSTVDQMIVKIEEPPKFRRRFSIFTEHLLTYINWDHVVVVGASVIASLQENEKYEKDSELRQYFREQWSQPIKLSIFGLDEVQMRVKIDEIVECISSFLPYPLNFRVKNSHISIKIDDRWPKIQISTKRYLDLAHVIIDQEVDFLSYCYDGRKIWTTIRGEYALKNLCIFYNSKISLKDFDNISRDYKINRLNPSNNIFKKEYQFLSKPDQCWVIVNFGKDEYDKLVQENRLIPPLIDSTKKYQSEKKNCYLTNFKKIEYSVEAPDYWDHEFEENGEDNKQEENQHQDEKEWLLSLEQKFLLEGNYQLIKEFSYELFELCIVNGITDILEKFPKEFLIPIFPELYLSDSDLLKVLIDRFNPVQVVSWLFHLQSKDPKNEQYLDLLKYLILKGAITQFVVEDINYQLIKMIVKSDPRFLNRYLSDHRSSYTPLSKIVALISKKINYHNRQKFLKELSINPKNLMEDENRYMFEEESSVEEYLKIKALLEHESFHCYLKEEYHRELRPVELYDIESGQKIEDPKLFFVIEKIWSGEIQFEELKELKLTFRTNISRRSVLQILFEHKNFQLFNLIINKLSDCELRTILHHESVSGSLLDLLMSDKDDKLFDLILENPRTVKLLNKKHYQKLLVIGDLERITKFENYHHFQDNLIEICHWCTPSTIYYLTQYRTDPESLVQTDHDGNTILHLLVRDGSTKYDDLINSIKLVARLSPELVHAKNKKGETPLFMIVKNVTIKNMTNSTDQHLFHLLVDLGSDLYVMDHSGLTVIHKSVLLGRRDLISSIFICDSEMINAIDKKERTPLMWALMMNDHETVNYLQNFCPTMEIRDIYMNSVSHYGALYSTVDTFDHLDQTSNIFGMTSFDYLQRRLKKSVATKDYVCIRNLELRSKELAKKIK